MPLALIAGRVHGAEALLLKPIPYLAWFPVCRHWGEAGELWRWGVELGLYNATPAVDVSAFEPVMKTSLHVSLISPDDDKLTERITTVSEAHSWHDGCCCPPLSPYLCGF